MDGNSQETIWQANETSFECTLLQRSSRRADLRARLRFCLCLQILGLSLLGGYLSVAAAALLARDEDSLLSTFLDDDEWLRPGSFDYVQTHHIIALFRGLLRECMGEPDPIQCRYDVKYSPRENQVIFGAIVDVEGDGSIEEADLEGMHQAICKSSLLNGDDLSLDKAARLVDICRYNFLLENGDG
ncbi:hypothetical protein B0T10DRAFT_566625 [Thelonectria olida]|uniref:Uncharacterized protein n=1 Tax=Thelonectria olida TaxID=1576542 RepID=A0A9P8VWZ1_9HYPO|nr:hypothetical protein B0T10DRAFT_566625 [Thelonectria olida]